MAGRNRKFIPLQGKSLAPIILGDKFRYRTGRTNSKIVYHGDLMPSLNHTFALSQTWRCAPKEIALSDSRIFPKNVLQWDMCDVLKAEDGSEVSVMGYSMRTSDYRYTMYVPFMRTYRVPLFNESLFAEELYDHRGEARTGSDNFKGELLNLALAEEYSSVVTMHREMLREYLWNSIVYVNLTSTFREEQIRSQRQAKRKKPWIQTALDLGLSGLSKALVPG